jgi:hypothetical protein
LPGSYPRLILLVIPAMRVATSLALMACSQLALSGCASHGIAPGAMPLTVATVTARAHAGAKLDSVTCESGAAASDAGGVHAALPAEPRLAPRWREDVARAVTVRIDDASGLAGWTPAYRAEVVAALRDWEAAGSPVSFTVVTNDARADVRIHWIDKFNSRYEGWTTVAWGEAGWLLNGDVTLALRSPRGQLLTSGERAQVALHEIGHVLGLSHNDSITSVMAPMVKVTAVAPEDIAALRALYLPRDSSEFALSLAQLTATHGRCAARRI